MLKRRQATGDTIIEVLLAVTIFSFLAGITLMLMNQSVNAAQRATEITLVRQQIDGQADMLRALHEIAAKSNAPNTTRWADIAKMADEASGSATSINNGLCPDQAVSSRHLRSKSFALDPDHSLNIIDSEANDRYKPAGVEAGTPPYAKVQDGTAYGIWIEPSTEGVGDENKVGTYVFRIRTCWDSPGINTPMQIETVVRLYDVLDGRDITGEDIADPTEDPDTDPDPIVFPTILSGRDALKCQSQDPLESNPNPTGSALFATPNTTYACNTVDASIYSCTNYDSIYNPALEDGEGGVYKVELEYEDAVCGTGQRDTIPTAAPYKYALTACVGSQSSCAWRSVAIDAPLNQGAGGVATFNVTLQPGDNLGIRWSNNQFFDGNISHDPDFKIKRITFTKVEG